MFWQKATYKNEMHSYDMRVINSATTAQEHSGSRFIILLSCLMPHNISRNKYSSCPLIIHLFTDIPCKHRRCHGRGESFAQPGGGPLSPAPPSGFYCLARLEYGSIWMSIRINTEVILILQGKMKNCLLIQMRIESVKNKNTLIYIVILWHYVKLRWVCMSVSRSYMFNSTTTVKLQLAITSIKQPNRMFLNCFFLILTSAKQPPAKNSHVLYCPCLAT